MDLLKIRDGKAWIYLDDKEMSVLDITAPDINRALGILLDSDTVQIALEEDPSMIVNPAEKIIFVQLRSSFEEVLESRESIFSEVDEVFSKAEAKYFQSEKTLEAEE